MFDAKVFDDHYDGMMTKISNFNEIYTKYTDTQIL